MDQNNSKKIRPFNLKVNIEKRITTENFEKLYETPVLIKTNTLENKFELDSPSAKIESNETPLLKKKKNEENNYKIDFIPLRNAVPSHGSIKKSQFSLKRTKEDINNYQIPIDFEPLRNMKLKKNSHSFSSNESLKKSISFRKDSFKKDPSSQENSPLRKVICDSPFRKKKKERSIFIKPELSRSQSNIKKEKRIIFGKKEKSLKLKKYSDASELIEDKNKKTNFSLHKEKHREKAYEILKKLPEKREIQDLNYLNDILKPVKFFSEISQNLDKASLLLIYKELNYEYYPKYKSIFYMGDIGRKFYIVLEGEVLVLMPKESKEINTKFSHRKSNIDFYKKLKTINSKEENDIENENDSIIYLYPDNKIVKRLENGETFGEIALEKKVPRTATIVCATNCHLASLTRESYNKILKNYFEKKNKDKRNIFQNLAIMKKFSEENIEGILHNCKDLYFVLNNNIYQEGEPSDYFYVIFDGIVELTQIKKNHDKNIDNLKLFNSIDEILDSKKKKEILKEGKIKEKVLNEKFLGLKNQKITISHLTKGQFFGDFEITLGINRITKATVKSHKATIISIHKDNFFDNAKGVNYWKELNDIHNTKEKWHNQYKNQNYFVQNVLSNKKHEINNDDLFGKSYVSFLDPFKKKIFEHMFKKEKKIYSYKKQSPKKHEETIRNTTNIDDFLKLQTHRKIKKKENNNLYNLITEKFLTNKNNNSAQKKLNELINKNNFKKKISSDKYNDYIRPFTNRKIIENGEVFYKILKLDKKFPKTLRTEETQRFFKTYSQHYNNSTDELKIEIKKKKSRKGSNISIEQENSEQIQQSNLNKYGFVYTFANFKEKV